MEQVLCAVEIGAQADLAIAKNDDPQESAQRNVNVSFVGSYPMIRSCSR